MTRAPSYFDGHFAISSLDSSTHSCSESARSGQPTGAACSFASHIEVASGHIVPVAEKRALAQSLGVALEADLDYVVDAEKLDAKCPSKYDGARANKDLSTKFE